MCSFIHCSLKALTWSSLLLLGSFHHFSPVHSPPPSLTFASMLLISSFWLLSLCPFRSLIGRFPHLMIVLWLSTYRTIIISLAPSLSSMCVCFMKVHNLDYVCKQSPETWRQRRKCLFVCVCVTLVAFWRFCFHKIFSILMHLHYYFPFVRKLQQTR